MDNNAAESIPAGRRFSATTLGYLLIAIVLIYWMTWLICALSNPTSTERLIMFYSVLPRRIAGIRVDFLMVIFSFLATIIGIIKKVNSGKKWYKTSTQLQFLILFGSLLLFINIFQLIF